MSGIADQNHTAINPGGHLNLFDAAEMNVRSGGYALDQRKDRIAEGRKEGRERRLPEKPPMALPGTAMSA